MLQKEVSKGMLIWGFMIFYIVFTNEVVDSLPQEKVHSDG